MKKITSSAGTLLVVLAVWVAAARTPASQPARPDPETVVYSSIQPVNWDVLSTKKSSWSVTTDGTRREYPKTCSGCTFAARLMLSLIHI